MKEISKMDIWGGMFILFATNLAIILTRVVGFSANASIDFEVSSTALFNAVAISIYMVFTRKSKRFWILPGFAIFTDILFSGSQYLFLSIRDGWLVIELLKHTYNISVLMLPYYMAITITIYIFLLPKKWHQQVFNTPRVSLW